MSNIDKVGLLRVTPKSQLAGSRLGKSSEAMPHGHAVVNPLSYERSNMENHELRKVAEIIFRQDLYPRIDTDPVAVQQYADSIELLPPIEINQHNEIIDGWHRWTAHKKQGLEEIHVAVTATKGDSELLELAIERNATHGLQLSKDDKQSMATKIYAATPDKERDAKKKHLCSILSVPDRTLRSWLSRIDKDARDARNKRIFNLWMASYAQDQIANIEGLESKSTVNDIISSVTAELPKSNKWPVAMHQIDFELPIYNIWRQQEKTTELTHPGNSEIKLVDNLLYLYTRPFDIVLDLFAGTGSTIDLCKKRLRRYWASDRKPIPEREKDIRLHDVVTDGLPSIPRWRDVKLVYLDPPYWKQSEGVYSQDPTDFGNMSLEDFNSNLISLIHQLANKLSEAYIALIIQPTQWNAPDRNYTDHIADILCAIQLPVDMRYSAPYSTQQYTPQMVDWAKENKKCLVLTREIIVWHIPTR